MNICRIELAIWLVNTKENEDRVLVLIKVNGQFDYEIDTTHNLLNNLRIMCQKHSSQAKMIIPDELFNDISNGYDIPASAEYYSPTANKYYELDFTEVLRDQLGDILIKDSVCNEVPSLSIEVRGYRLTPHGSLVAVEGKRLSAEVVKKEVVSPLENKINFCDSNPNDESQSAKSIEKDTEHNTNRDRFVKKIILGLLGAVIVIVMFAIAWFIMNMPVNNLKNAIEKNDYPAVVTIYNEKIYGHTSKENKVNGEIGIAIDGICSDYLSGQLEFQTASDNLQILEALNNDELALKAKNAASEIEMQENSSSSYMEGLSYLEKCEYVSAIKVFQEVHENSEYYNDAQKQIEICVQDLVDSVNDLNDENAYLSALDTIDSALELLPNDSELIQCRNSLYSKYETLVVEKTISSADELMAQENYKEALNVIDASINRLGQVQKLLGKRSEYEETIRAKYIANTDAYVDSNDYANAFQEINNALDILKKDAVLSAKNDELKTKFVEYITLQVDTKVKDGKFDDALTLISEAKSIFTCSELDTLYKNVEEKKAEAIEKEKNYTAKNVDFLKFEGSITSDDETDKYSITAIETGYYRCFLADMVSGFKVKVYVYNSDGSKVNGDYGLGNGDGVTCQLEKDKKYTIEVINYSNTGSYTLLVGQQKSTINATSHEVIYDSIEYVDQTNNHTFVPEYSGVYHFGLSNMVNGFKVKLYVYDSLGYKVSGDYGLGINEGVTANLNAGEEYAVILSYYSNLGDYTLSIGKQRPTEDITGKEKISGNVDFKDQNNVYTFTVANSGKYRFTLGDMKSDLKLKLYVYDKLGYKIGGDYSLSSGNYISTNLETGQTYEVHISQYSNTGNYTINITKE